MTVTVVAIDFKTYDLTKYSVERSLQSIDADDVLVISDIDFVPGSRFVKAPPVTGMEQYANLMLKGVGEHVNTSHALYVQWDGIAYRPDLWTDEFLEYDYIGAPWPWRLEPFNVGNGGFSLRSKKLLDICATDPVMSLTKDEPIAEDNIIGVHQRLYLERKHGIKFAPTKLAEQFSFELGHMRNSFGFHGLWNVIAQMTEMEVAHYLPLIDYSGWNIYKWAHTLNAAMSRDNKDTFVLLLEKLKEHNPELLEPVSNHLEQVAENETLAFL